MKKILLISIFFLSIAIAQKYSVYDVNGKKQESFKGQLNKHTLTELTKKYHSAVLIKKNDAQKVNLALKPSLAQINNVTRTIDINRNSISNNEWIEVDKNETIKICINNKVTAWETYLNSNIINDSCLAFQVPTFVGVNSLKIFFSDTSYTINLAIGMKYLNFKNETITLGYEEKEKTRKKINIKYNESGFPIIEDISQLQYGEWTYFGKNIPSPKKDYKRYVSVSGSYLVDKYPVTNCEFIQLRWNDIPDSTYSNWYKRWTYRKSSNSPNHPCPTNDSAANSVFLFQAMKYANARSIRDGLKPYYKFSMKAFGKERILSKNQYVISYNDFPKINNNEVLVSIDSESNGYRLPYYNEWMMFARGGDGDKNAPWGDSASFNDVLKHAKFGTGGENFEKTEPVGQLQPNGYGLYDFFGVVWELVFLEKSDSYYLNTGHPYCLKGGDNYVGTRWDPNWKSINYGYTTFGTSGGFRLIRNIDNNAKWIDSKSNKE